MSESIWDNRYPLLYTGFYVFFYGAAITGEDESLLVILVFLLAPF
jgi:hypothetical protein